jgi:GC-rich sequence DNA-binding factor
MNAITGKKEREERREQFYSVRQHDSENEDSDVEMNEWENQQIRKGVTGAQLMTAHQESTFSSQYMIPPLASNAIKISGETKPVLTTAELLEQAYSQTNHEISRQIKKEKKKEVTKSSGIKTPQEILKNIELKLKTSRELNHKHYLDIERIKEELSSIAIDLDECNKNQPESEKKYKFYQEQKLFTMDLTECLNEKLPEIIALEEKAMSVMSNYSKRLIERRRQDVRDQAKEITDTSK